MKKYTNIITNKSGDALPGITIKVLNQDGTTATIYSDNGTTQIPDGVLNTDGGGSFSFYAANGRYNLQVSGQGINTYTLQDELLYDPHDDESSLAGKANAVDLASTAIGKGMDLIGDSIRASSLANTANGKGADLIANAAKKVTSIATLRTLRVPTGSDSDTVVVQNYWPGISGGGGVFLYMPSYTAADDAGNVIMPNSAPASGRWVRQRYNGVYNPRHYGAIGDGTSHPLSSQFATLAAAQAVYPHAQTLTDEIDWAAIQAVFNTIATTVVPLASYNFSSGKVIFPVGTYLINRTVTINSYGIRVEGEGSTDQPYGSANIKWTGGNGTVDSPIWMFDVWARDEFGNYPTIVGSNKNATYGNRRCEIHHLSFEGNSPNMSTINYVSAIRFRQGAFNKVTHCNFKSVYDGINFTAPQMFCDMSYNFFYGCVRDCIGVWRYYNDFSTTVWIHNNEFGLYGRSAMMLDASGSVDASFLIYENDIEGGWGTGPYYSNPATYPGGLQADVILINQGSTHYHHNRHEAGTLIHAVALIGSDTNGIRDNTFSHNYSAAGGGASIGVAASAGPKAAASTQLTNSHYQDITDVRNITLDPSAPTVNSLSLENNKITGGNCMFVYGNALSSSGAHSIKDQNASIKQVGISGGVANYGSITDYYPSNIELIRVDNGILDPVSKAKGGGGATQFGGSSGFATVLSGSYRFNRFGEIWFRNSNSTWGPVAGYDGWQINRLLANPLTAPGNGLDSPLFLAHVINSDGSTGEAIYEIAGAVMTDRIIRYNYTAAPTGANNDYGKPWKAGDTVYNKTPTRTKNIEKWVHNGTNWQAYGTGWGTTAERPTLTANDAGYSFKDTTTSTLVVWTGTAWV